MTIPITMQEQLRAIVQGVVVAELLRCQTQDGWPDIEQIARDIARAVVVRIEADGIEPEEIKDLDWPGLQRLRKASR